MISAESSTYCSDSIIIFIVSYEGTGVTWLMEAATPSAARESGSDSVP